MEQRQTPLIDRVRRMEEEMFKLIVERRAGGQTVKSFCQLHDLTQGIYYYRQKEYLTKHNLSAIRQSGFMLKNKTVMETTLNNPQLNEQQLDMLRLLKSRCRRNISCR